MMITWLFPIVMMTTLIFAGLLLWQTKKFSLFHQQLQAINIRLEERDYQQTQLRETLLQLLQQQQQEQQTQRARLDEQQIKNLATIQESLQLGMTGIRQQVTEALNNYAQLVGQQIEKLTQLTDQHLKEITGQVEKRLAEGFEKTTLTFGDVLKRLALIDEAQKKITELSTSVVSLQEVLADKRSRGAFGEIQLSALIHNMMPSNSFALQHTLSNHKIVDCMLFLPEPTGNIAIDAKFPLENYRRSTDIQLSTPEREIAEQQFAKDIQKHIQDIANRYIIPGETAEGAMMFIPAEAIFAEIHAHHPALVEAAQQARVWMVSPTTMMAILTTARAVLKDEATRKQVHVIQQHLKNLAEDFKRFEERMDALKKHIDQAQEDAESVHKSSRKISSRFIKIEKVELAEEKLPV